MRFAHDEIVVLDRVGHPHPLLQEFQDRIVVEVHVVVVAAARQQHLAARVEQESGEDVEHPGELVDDRGAQRNKDRPEHDRADDAPEQDPVLILARHGEEGEHHADDKDVVEGESRFQEVAGGKLDRRLGVQIVRLVVVGGIGLIAEINVEAESDGERREARPHDGALFGRDNFVLLVEEAEVHPEQQGDEGKERDPQPDGLAGVRDGQKYRHGKSGVRKGAPR